jgi:hypothetical protein
VDEREVLRAWRDIFRGMECSPDAIAKAETLLDSLSGESPLHLRLANELSELQKGQEPAPVKKKRTSRKLPT